MSPPLFTRNCTSFSSTLLLLLLPPPLQPKPPPLLPLPLPLPSHNSAASPEVVPNPPLSAPHQQLHQVYMVVQFLFSTGGAKGANNHIVVLQANTHGAQQGKGCQHNCGRGGRSSCSCQPVALQASWGQAAALL
jgi:hypothetical protein